MGTDAVGVERAWVMVPSSILYDGSWIDEVMAEKIERLTSTLAAGGRGKVRPGTAPGQAVAVAGA